MDFHRISRRDCVKVLLWSTCVSWVAGQRWTSPMAAEVTAAATEPDAVFRFRLADFPALDSAGGSVRFGGSSITSYFQDGIERTQAAGIFPTFFVNRPTSAPNYVALAAECTHEGCIIDILASGIHVCPCHGSRFSAVGKRLRTPAMANLPTYDLLVEPDGVLAVILPGSIDGVILRFDAIPLAISEGLKRLKISFSSFSGMTYEVRFKPFGQEDAEVVPHSITDAGAADSDSVGGIDDVLVVYVDAPLKDGVFQVAIVVTEV